MTLGSRRPTLCRAAFAILAASIGGAAISAGLPWSASPTQGGKGSGGLCAGGDEEPVALQDGAGPDITVALRNPDIEYLAVSAQVVDSTGRAHSERVEDSFHFVPDSVSETAVLPPGTYRRGSVNELTVTTGGGDDLVGGDYCEEVELKVLVGDGHHREQTIKRTRCFELVQGARRPLSLAAFSSRSLELLPAVDKDGNPTQDIGGSSVPAPPPARSGEAVLQELAKADPLELHATTDD